MPTKVFFDIGAEGGCWTNIWAKDPNNADAQIYSFEPNKDSFQKLQRHTGGHPNVHLYNKAISNIDGILTFYVNNEADTSSLLPFDEEGLKKWCRAINHSSVVKTVTSYQVECIRLATFIKQNNIQSIDHIKIDTQGHDFEVVKSLDEYIRIVKQIYLEVQVAEYELYKNQSKKDELVKYMESYNFVIKEILPQTCGLEENILFVNKGIPC